MDSTMEQELEKCQKYAEEGYKFANQQCNEICNTLADERRKIRAANYEQNQMKRVENTGLISKQEEGLNKLSKSRIAVFGIGGVGSFTAEALARSGISHLILIELVLMISVMLFLLYFLK